MYRQHPDATTFEIQNLNFTGHDTHDYKASAPSRNTNWTVNTHIWGANMNENTNTILDCDWWLKTKKKTLNNTQRVNAERTASNSSGNTAQYRSRRTYRHPRTPETLFVLQHMLQSGARLQQIYWVGTAILYGPLQTPSRNKPTIIFYSIIHPAVTHAHALWTQVARNFYK